MPHKILLNRTFFYKGKKYKIVKENSDNFTAQDSTGAQIVWPKEVIEVGRILSEDSKKSFDGEDAK